MRHPEHLARPVTLLATACVWSHLLRQWRSSWKEKPVLKKHGYAAQSLFHYVLDYLRATFLHLDEQQTTFLQCLQPLRQPRKFLSCS